MLCLLVGRGQEGAAGLAVELGLADGSMVVSGSAGGVQDGVGVGICGIRPAAEPGLAVGVGVTVS